MGKEIKYTLHIDGETSELTQKLKALKVNLKTIIDSGEEPRINKILEKIGVGLDNIKSKAATPIKSEGMFFSVEKDIQGVNRSLEGLSEQLTDIKNLTKEEKIELFPEKESKKLQDINGALAKYTNTIKAAKEETKEIKNAKKAEADANDTLNEKLQIRKQLTDSLDTAKSAKIETEQAIKEAEARQKEAESTAKLVKRIKEKIQAKKEEAAANGKTYDESKANFGDGQGNRVTLREAEARAAAAAAAAAGDNLDALKEKLRSTSTVITAYNNALKNNKIQIDQAQGAYDAAKTKLENLNNSFDTQRLKAEQEAFTNLRTEAQKLGVDIQGIGTENTDANITLLKTRMEEVVNDGIKPLDDSLNQSIGIINSFRATNDQASASIEKSTQEFKEQSAAAGEVEGLVNRIKQFTGLTGAAIIARKALRSAFNTIKELDKQMTEMAVVTNLEVGDYWKQLPEHTKRANELGIAIKDVYEAETLYYQQGLKTAQVTKLSTSTLKMARIAGLSAEDATNKMTAALRGFNMEINETNADRIADVYSKLAAITASNVEEISSAMTKTASIASNAGMEFETTAAFLSQIIETTRESAETAGTALKTVIARFQELKKSPDEIGEVDGEIVDANKIETALRTVGVALRDTSGQFRDLDDVFLELASKWDSLDMNTQRYIATIAAGSRQQSRFVAMMSNYSRTQELVSAANNAAGASNDQFAKTLESLESKLAALKNAWDNFTMGLANSSLIKGVIDILTNILNAVNWVTDAFGEWPGMAAKIGVLTIALIAGSKAIKAFTASMNLGNGIMVSFGKALKAPLTGLKSFFTSLKLGTKVQTQYIKTNATVTKATQIYNNAVKTQKAVEEARKKGIIKLTTAENAFAKTEADKAAAAVTAAKAYGLNAIQQTAMNDLLNEGIPLNVAAAAAQQGLNKEKLEELALTSTDNALQGLSLEERKQKIAAMFAEKAAEDTVITSKRKGLLLTLAEKAAHILEKLHLTWLIPAKYREALGIQTVTGAKAAEIPVTQGQTTANIGLLATLWPILAVMLLITAAVLAAIAIWKGLQALFAWFHSNTPEGQFEAASEALEKATEVADAAAEAYTTLKDSLTELNEKYDALDELTVGTQEWREALMDVNAEVMDLIDQYPELAKDLKIDANGVMRLNEETQKLVLKQQEETKARAQNAKLSAQIAKNDAENNLKYSKLSDEAVAGWDIYYGNGVNNQKDYLQRQQDITSQFAADYAAGSTFTRTENGIDEEEFLTYAQDVLQMEEEEAKQWLEELDQETLDELEEYGNSLNAASAAEEAALKSMLSNAQALIDTNKYTEEQLQQMINIGTDVMQKKIDEAQAKVDEAGDDKDLDEDKDYLAYWEGIYGKGNVEVDGDGEVTIKGQNGEEDIELTAEEARAQYAAGEATEKVATLMEKLPKALNSVSANLQKGVTENGRQLKKRNTEEASAIQSAINNAFNDDTGMKMNRADLTSLNKEALQDLYEMDDTFKELYGSFTEFEAEMNKRTKNANAAFTKNREALDNINLQDFYFDNSLTADAEKGLVEHMAQIVAVSGPEVGKQLGNSINDLLSSVALEDRDKLAAQLNAIDWHNATDLEGLPDTLEELGINLPNDQLEAFIEDAKAAAHAIHDIDLDKLNEQLIGLNKTLKEIDSNNQGRAFDESTYESLIEIDPDLANDFIQNLDSEYVYLGTSMDKLREAIIAQTDALIEEGGGLIQNKIDTANILDKLIGSGDTRFSTDGSVKNFSASGSWSEDESREFVQSVIDAAVAGGYSLDGISAYLSTNTKVENLTADKLDEIVAALRSIYGQQDKLTAELTSKVGQAEAATKLRDDTYYATRSTGTTAAADQSRTRHLSEEEIADYQSSRKSIITQATNLGISETDIKTLARYNAALKELEKNNKTNTDQYKRLAAEANNFMNAISTKTSFESMYQGIEENVEALDELVESYKNTTDEIQKQYIVAQMVSEFGIQVTDENFQQIANNIDAFLHGEEQGFINIVTAAAESAGLATDAYAIMSEALMEELSIEYQAFAEKMIDAGYAYVDSATGIFHWGTQQVLNVAKDVVDQGDKFEAWESPYDWLYNANQKVNASIRERNQLEREYNRMVEDGSASVADLAANINGQVNALSSQAQSYKNIYEDAKTELMALMDPAQNSAYAELLKDAVAIGPNGQITVDKEKLYAAGYSSDEGGVAEDMIGEIESLVDTMMDAQDNMEDSYDAIRELAKTGKEEYTNLLERVTDALKEQYQKEIDKLNNINDAINDANEALLSKMQEQIDNERSARDQAKALENIQDKQAKLAYLQASGGSKTEILSLQKEIENDQQSYEDSLVDRALSEMEKANQAAADQRQQQIDIAQAQYDWWAENHAIQDAEEVLNTSLKAVQEGTKLIDTDVGKLLYGTDNVAAMSKKGVEDWYNTLNNSGNLAGIWQGINGTPDAISANMNPKLQELSTNITTAEGQIKTDTQTMATDVSSLAIGNNQLITDQSATRVSASDINQKIGGFVSDLNEIKAAVNGSRASGISTPDIDTPALDSAGSTNNQNFSMREVGTIPYGTTPFIDQTNEQVDYFGKKYIQGNDGFWYLLSDTYEQMWLGKKYYAVPSGKKRYGMQRFKSGGLADETGPAWLDGTKSNPELVLNATDTANFIQLKDVLADVLKATSSTSKTEDGNKNKIGDNYYTIDVHVDSIESDYDIDQAVDRIKEIIEADAMYRNVNAINLIR